MLLSPVPSEKPDFNCHNHLSFLPGTGRKLSELRHLILPQYYASVEKKIRPRNGPEIQCLPRLKDTSWCPVAFCFQMKMLCTTEELQ